MKSYSHRLMGIAILENMQRTEDRLSKQALLLDVLSVITILSYTS